ncbi:MAG: phosphoribosylanthranilate isomerase [Alphaproteobacteria bacterium]|nr:phosphoribosylanthranilate isomerase [Alphaproteobacteria bacterium]
MAPFIKICGVTTLEVAEAAAEAGASHIGFASFPKSPRHLTNEAAHRLASAVPKSLARVLLMVEPDDDALAAAVEAVDPAIIQLHGRETPQRVSAIKGKFGRPVMKVLSVAARADLAAVAAYTPISDYLLFDAKPQAGDDRPGGLGRVFDWSLLKGIDRMRPVIVSGGLDAGNVAKAVRESGADGVDVSSGVETAPGRKDPRLVAEFIKAARAAFAEAVPS